jgi:peptidoglycan/xylan/chitin deacetylase (PgdA/CDA1 family)
MLFVLFSLTQTSLEWDPNADASFLLAHVCVFLSGHEISGHTWAHPQLTTLTNEQIVA